MRWPVAPTANLWIRSVCGQPALDPLLDYVPKRNPIVLASFMIEPHYTKAINNENKIKHEVIHRIEKNQGV